MRSRMFIDILIGKKMRTPTPPKKNASEIVTTE